MPPGAAMSLLAIGAARGPTGTAGWRPDARRAVVGAGQVIARMRCLRSSNGGVERLSAPQGKLWKLPWSELTGAPTRGAGWVLGGWAAQARRSGGGRGDG